MNAETFPRIETGAVVWDNHACMPLRPHDRDFLPMLDRCRDAGVHVVALNIGFGEQTMAEHIAMLAAFRRWVEDHSDGYMLVSRASDALAAKASGRLGICFDIEGMQALGGQLDMVSLYYALGVRWMLVAYNRANQAGGGCMDAEDGGLTDFGRAVIAEMNRVGMVVCGSHTGHRSAREMIDLSAAPMIFSHSNAQGVWDNSRNIPDDLMRACAARGGVIGLNGFGMFLGPDGATIDAFVRHVEYALDLVGEDHVGIALDYVFDYQELIDYFDAHPALFPREKGYAGTFPMIPPWRLGEIAAALEARGYKAATLAKVLGGNHLRIAETVWK